MSYREGDRILFRVPGGNREKATIREITAAGKVTIEFDKEGLANKTLYKDKWESKLSTQGVTKRSNFSGPSQSLPGYTGNIDLSTASAIPQRSLTSFFAVTSALTSETNDTGANEVSDPPSSTEDTSIEDELTDPPSSTEDTSIEDKSTDKNNNGSMNETHEEFHETFTQVTIEMNSNSTNDDEDNDDSAFFDSLDEISDEEEEDYCDVDADIDSGIQSKNDKYYGRRGDLEDRLSPLDLAKVNIAPLLVLKGFAIQVMFPTTIISAMSCILFQSAFFCFQLRNVFDNFTRSTGKLSNSLLGFTEEGRRKARMSFTGWFQVLVMLRPFLVEYKNEFGTVKIHNSLYLVLGKLAASIGWHRDSDSADYLGRMCVTLLHDGVTKKTIFKYKPNGHGQAANKGSSILNPHASILFMDKYASGRFSNIHHTTKIEGGASMTIVIDLYLNESNKDKTLQEVVQHMIDHKIFEPMNVQFTVEK